MSFSLLKSFLKKFDYFGVNFNFQYKSKSKYQSATGGCTFIIFLFVSLTYLCINLVPFVKRKNVSIIYYTTQLPHTDSISLKNFSSNIGVGIICDSLEDKDEIYKLLKIELNFVSFSNNKNKKVKNRKNFELKKCDYSSFYNEYNETMDQFGFSNFYCPLIYLNDSIHGIYGDDLFEYYEFTVKSTAQSNEDEEKLLNLLTQQECLLKAYFIDVAIDVNDFKNPTRFFLNSKFVALKPGGFVKWNMFFKLNLFETFENFLFNNHKSTFYLGYAGHEEYEVFKSLNRFDLKPVNYDVFGKIYIRADGQRNIIQRKYMQINELLANISSIISQIFICLYIGMLYINSFYAKKSLMKKIFQIKDGYKANSSQNEIKNELRNIKNKVSSHFKMKNNRYESECGNLLQNERLKAESSLKKTNTANEIEKKLKLSVVIATDFHDQTNNTIQLNKSKENNNFNVYSNKQNKNTSSHFLHKIISNKNVIKRDVFPFNYSAYELIVIFFFPCVSWKKLRKKLYLLQKCETFMIYQLDIMNYLKSLQLIDLINYIIFEKEENIILNFLSKPSVSLANKIDFCGTMNKVNDITKSEVNNFYSSFQSILSKNYKTSKEEKFCLLTHFELQNFLIQRREKKCNTNTSTSL